MTQGWENFSKNYFINPPQNNMSNYQRMLAETDPRVIDEVDQYIKDIPQGGKNELSKSRLIKNPNAPLLKQLSRNAKQTGRALMKGGTVAGKAIGKASPFIGAGVSGYDAFRSFNIANDMDKINQVRPGTFRQEEIDFYRNKGKAISAGMGLGAGTGAIAGAGAFSLPGAAAGAGIGGMLGDWGYGLTQINNQYKNAWDKASPEIKALLMEYYKNSGDSGANSNSVNNNGASTSGVTQTKSPSSNRGMMAPIINSQQQTAQETEQPNIDAINNYIAQLQRINQPYVDALKNYVDNYNNLLDRTQRSARFWQGASALTGNPRWANMVNVYNPLTNEANRVAAVKQLQDAQAGDLNAINEVMGNMEIAKEMDLPYEAAFANKNLLTALTANRRNLTDWEKAQLAAELKRYGIDVGYNKAINVQNLRNQGNLQNALIYYGMYNGGGVAPGLNSRGVVPTQQGTPQPSGEAALFQQVVGR